MYLAPLVTADSLSVHVCMSIQNSMAGPACEGLQLSNSRGQHLLLHKFSPRHQHLCAIFTVCCQSIYKFMYAS